MTTESSGTVQPGEIPPPTAPIPPNLAEPFSLYSEPGEAAVTSSPNEYRANDAIGLGRAVGGSPSPFDGLGPLADPCDQEMPSPGDVIDRLVTDPAVRYPDDPVALSKIGVALLREVYEAIYLHIIPKRGIPEDFFWTQVALAASGNPGDSVSLRDLVSGNWVGEWTIRNDTGDVVGLRQTIGGNAAQVVGDALAIPNGGELRLPWTRASGLQLFNPTAAAIAKDNATLAGTLLVAFCGRRLEAC